MIIQYTVEYDTDSKMLTIDGRGAVHCTLKQAAEEVSAELIRQKRYYDVNNAFDNALNKLNR